MQGVCKGDIFQKSLSPKISQKFKGYKECARGLKYLKDLKLKKDRI
jgi:hypothetical protein